MFVFTVCIFQFLLNEFSLRYFSNLTLTSFFQYFYLKHNFLVEHHLTLSLNCSFILSIRVSQWKYFAFAFRLAKAFLHIIFVILVFKLFPWLNIFNSHNFFDIFFSAFNLTQLDLTCYPFFFPTFTRNFSILSMILSFLSFNFFVPCKGWQLRLSNPPLW